jgi:hypothetical protein
MSPHDIKQKQTLVIFEKYSRSLHFRVTREGHVSHMGPRHRRKQHSGARKKLAVARPKQERPAVGQPQPGGWQQDGTGFPLVITGRIHMAAIANCRKSPF